MKKNPKASFRKGFVQLRQVDVPAFKARLLKALEEEAQTEKGGE